MFMYQTLGLYGSIYIVIRVLAVRLFYCDYIYAFFFFIVIFCDTVL